MSRRPTRTELRRAQLARRVHSLDALEPRSLVTESLGILTAGIGLPATPLIARPEAGSPAQPRRRPASHTDGMVMVPASPPAPAAGAAPRAAVDPSPLPVAGSGEVTLAIPAPNAITLTRPAAPAAPSAGGAAGSSHGGSGAVAPMPATSVPARATPATTSAATAPAILPVAIAGGPDATGAPSAREATTARVASPSPASPRAGSTSPWARPGAGDTISIDAVANAAVTFTNFPLYTLDYNAGTVLFPGARHVATPGGNVDLRAQVRDAAVTSYSWNTAGLANATSITGASTYRLQFQWATTFASDTTNSATLTVTKSGGLTEVQTYTFALFAGSGSAGTGTATWPTSLAPDTVSPSAPSFPAHYASVDANSGALDTSISLPSYNPNVPAVVLAYDTMLADPRPNIVVLNTLDPALSIPTRVTAQLTFNGTAGSTYYYDTSQLIPGDVQQIALRADATALATGRYAYSASIGTVRGSTSTATYSGTATILNGASNAFGAGWTLAGLERITTATGGVILDLGAGGRSLWFATGAGSTYTSPAGDFSTLVVNGGGTYTRTLTDGTRIQFDSSGRQVAVVDLHNVALTYAYDGSGRLSTILDPYGNTTTFAYDAGTGKLKTVADPAGRLATFTLTGSDLTGVTLPDNSTWGYAYNALHRITQVTDPRGKLVTVAYDNSGRVGTVTNPDLTASTYSSYQRAGFVPAGSGTSGSPYAPTLLAEARATYVDPLGNTTDLRPDRRGLGLTGVSSDPLGLIATADRDANGLATIAVDPLNRASRFAYDSKGNVTSSTFPDGTTSSATYDGNSRVLTATDELSRITTFTYSGQGDLTNVRDPLGIRVTMTYSGTGQLISNSNPGGYYSGGGLAGGGTISYAYDAQDRMTTVADALTHATTASYDSAGRVTAVKDANNNVTTYTYDPMGRLLTTVDPLNHTTTNAYDAIGNRTAVVDPLGHATSYGYDAMNRLATVVDARGKITTYTYDNAGRLASIKDSASNLTTYAYDADGRQVGSTDPNGNRTTLSYDAAGQLVGKVDRDDRHTSYAYDLRGRIVTEKWLDVSLNPINVVTHAYDAAGQLTALSDSSTILTYTYDNAGRRTGVRNSGSSGQPAVTLSSTYYDSGEEASQVDSLSPARTIAYSYDAAFRLTSIVVTGGPRVDFGYDAGDRVTSLTRIPSSGSNVTSSYAYDAADRLTTITHQVAGGSALATYVYGYDNANRLTSEANAEGTVAYSYDDTDQLTGVSGARSESYTYDDNGNRTMSGYATGTGNRMSSGAGYTYTYDDEGNLASKTKTSNGDVWTYDWDYRNRLTRVVEKNSSNVELVRGTYTYDALDRRIGVDETVSGTRTTTWTVYDGSNPYADFNGSGTLLTRYLYGPAVDQLLARTSAAGTTAWYLADKLGTVRDIASTSGTVLDHVAYDSYGNVTSETSPGNGDRFKFAAREFDAAIGLYYNRARYYDPAAGRFVGQDPIGFGGGDRNLYRYTGNNPTNFTDPSGNQQYPPPGIESPPLSPNGNYGGSGNNSPPVAPPTLSLERLTTAQRYEYNGIIDDQIKFLNKIRSQIARDIYDRQNYLDDSSSSLLGRANEATNGYLDYILGFAGLRTQTSYNEDPALIALEDAEDKLAQHVAALYSQKLPTFPFEGSPTPPDWR